MNDCNIGAELPKHPNTSNFPREDYQTFAERITYALIFFDAGIHLALCQVGQKGFLKGFGPHGAWVESEENLYNALHHRNCNYALLTGTGGQDRRLSVIDFDDLGVYETWRGMAGRAAETFTVRTARGVHVYFWTMDPRSWNGTGFEVMGEGKAIMGALSVHPSGQVYKPMNAPRMKHIDSLESFSLLSNPPERKVSTSPRALSFTQPLEGGLLARIKAEYKLLNVIASRPMLERRMNLKSTDGGKGRWYLGACPFHTDEKPSMWIDAARNLFGCYSCDAKGDVINFIARLDGMDERALIAELANDLRVKNATT